MKASANTRGLACSVGGWKCDNRRGDVAAFGRIVWGGVCHQDIESIELNEGMSGPYSQSSGGHYGIFGLPGLNTAGGICSCKWRASYNDVCAVFKLKISKSSDKSLSNKR